MVMLKVHVQIPVVSKELYQAQFENHVSFLCYNTYNTDCLSYCRAIMPWSATIAI